MQNNLNNIQKERYWLSVLIHKEFILACRSSKHKKRIRLNILTEQKLYKKVCAKRTSLSMAANILQNIVLCVLQKLKSNKFGMT